MLDIEDDQKDVLRPFTTIMRATIAIIVTRTMMNEIYKSDFCCDEFYLDSDSFVLIYMNLNRKYEVSK